MRLAILANDGDTLFEYKESDVKRMLKELLNEYDFEVAWEIIINKLKGKTRLI